MSIERQNFPQFFITAPAPCPYVEGQLERKVFTHLIGPDAWQLHDKLTKGGFRRSQNIAYRPACDTCTACVSVRIPIDRFDWTRTFRRVWKRNLDLVASSVEARANNELYGLFRDYIDARHQDGGMVDMTPLDFSAMMDESFVDTSVVEYRLKPEVSLSGPDQRQGRLIAAALSDRMEDGLSMIYSFFDPGQTARSLGTYMILEHIERTRKLGLPYLYLGYWVKQSAKMAYKARFLPQERLTQGGWELHS